MVCIRFQGIIMVLPIDKNKSKVFGKREGFFVLIKRTARSYTCVAVYVCVHVLSRKILYWTKYYLPTLWCMLCMYCRACIWIFQRQNHLECINFKVLCFMAIITMYVVPKKLKKFSSLVRHTIDKSHICSHHHQSKVLWIEV